MPNQHHGAAAGLPIDVGAGIRYKCDLAFLHYSNFIFGITRGLLPRDKTGISILFSNIMDNYSLDL